MAVRTNRRRQAKTTRISNQWSQVGSAVFEALGVTRDELEGLEHQLLGWIVLPGMPDYDQGREADGLCPHVSQPEIIVYCAVPNDVRLCLAWSHEHEWWVTCRSGGHSIAGYSVNSGIVIDVSEIHHVSVDPRLRQARVGAGTRFEELNSVLDTFHLHLPGGTCTDVGVAGYMQGGGYGLTSLQFGMHCDSVIEVTVMLSDGRIVVANSAKNSDLFWAIRGGTGNNFGVLLEITYQLYDLYKAWGFCLQWPIDEAPAALVELQRGYMRDLVPPQLGYVALLATVGGKPVLLMPGIYDGERAQALAGLAPLLNSGHPELRIDTSGTYAELNASLFAVCPDLPLGHIRETKNSGYIATALQRVDWESVTRYVATSPNPYNMAVIEPYGGAINRYPVAGSAFIHRSAYMDFFVDSFYEIQGQLTPETEAQAWLDGFMQLMRPYFNGHVYQNYPVRDFSNFRWAYWGDSFNSLLFVKQKYDPANFFYFEQSISRYPDDQRAGVERSTASSMFTDGTIVYEPHSEGVV